MLNHICVSIKHANIPLLLVRYLNNKLAERARVF